MFSPEIVGPFFDSIKKKCISSHIFAISEEALSLSNRLLPEKYNVPDLITAEAVLAPLCLDAYLGCKFEDRPITDSDTLYKIFEYMYDNYRDPITLESTAASIGVHPITVSRVFSKYSGVGFNYYVRYLRSIYAAELISNSTLNFTQIAYEAGFGSVRSFNRAFAGIYGVTPGEYKRSK